MRRMLVIAARRPCRDSASQLPPCERSRPPNTSCLPFHQPAGAAGRSWNSSRLAAIARGKSACVFQATAMRHMPAAYQFRGSAFRPTLYPCVMAKLLPYERQVLREIREWQAETPSWGTRLLAKPAGKAAEVVQALVPVSALRAALEGAHRQPTRDGDGGCGRCRVRRRRRSGPGGRRSCADHARAALDRAHRALL